MSKWTNVIDATGPAGNIFVVLGTARALLRQMDAPQAEIAELTNRVFAAPSYTKAISVIEEWFPVVLGGENEPSDQ